jgi:hypothetical protein
VVYGAAGAVIHHQMRGDGIVRRVSLDFARRVTTGIFGKALGLTDAAERHPP